MEKQIICAGFGGQGILFMGKLLAQVAMTEGKEITWMPSYGAEMRGGTANCMVVVSRQKIASPIVSFPTSCIVMNAPSFDKFEPRLKSEGNLFINTSLISQNSKRNDIEVIGVPATEITDTLGNARVANVVMVGAYIAKTDTVEEENIIEALGSLLTGKKKELLKINYRAFQKGVESVHE